jgi:alanine-glyoxylate transaminase/serine-glyoxylate transaminase/serine-pyruvate transaminase
MVKIYEEMKLPRRILMGPGPSNVPDRVMTALASPVVGHLDPAFLSIMEEVQEMLRAVMGTENRFTLPVSGTGSAGMEAALVNLLEPGDKALVCVNGVFGERMCDIVGRCGAELKRVDAPWGSPVDPGAVRKALGEFPAKVVAVVHAETSTGVLQPLEELAKIAREREALFLVDAVTSLAGAPLEVDSWGIDVCYSGTQKCLSCPPGLAPITFGPRAMEVLEKRKTKVRSWYLDMTMILKYWGPDRVYHHTAPISMTYALREALRIVLEEGLEKRWQRHRTVHHSLVRGLEKIGLRMLVEEPYRAPMINTVVLPGGVDDLAVRRRLLGEYSLEIGGGLGALKGKVWRIGIMEDSCTEENVQILLAALAKLL